MKYKTPIEVGGVHNKARTLTKIFRKHREIFKLWKYTHAHVNHIVMRGEI